MIILRNKYEEIPYNSDNVKKYKSNNNLLRHAKINKDTKGIMLVDKSTKSLIGYCAWENDYIVALEVLSDYRGKGYGDVLLEKAIKSGCNKLSVSKNNTVAINLYKKHKFTYDKDINEKVIEMRLKSMVQQREYTSVSRKIGAKIGRLRANVANKIYKRAAIQEVQNDRIGHYVKLKESNPGPNSGQRLMRNLLMPVIKDGSIKIKPSDKFRLHYDITGGDNTTMEANIKSRLFAPQFSHELGHYAINTGQDKESKKVFDKLVKLENEKESGNFLGKIYKQHLKNKYTRKNESNASRNGLEILKKVGANQGELDLAKEVCDKAGKSYETSQKYKLLRDIGDRINIKDRRNTRVMYRGGEPVHVGMTKFKLERRKKK